MPDIDEEVEVIKKKMEKHIYGKTYAGYCRACGKLVVKGFEAYISQLQGDNVVVDVYHKIHL